MNRTQQTRQVPTGIDYAVSAAWELISAVHIGGHDQCLIATFGDHFRIARDLTTSKSELVSTLVAIANSDLDGGTRFYDSLEDTVVALLKQGRQDSEKVIVAVTDGVDNRSRNYPHTNPRSPEMIGRYLGSRFADRPGHHAYLIGVGLAETAGVTALSTIAHHSKIKIATVRTFPVLQEIFSRIAIAMTSEISDVHHHLGNGWFLSTPEEKLRITRRPIDYAILIDRSGSMGDPVTTL